MNEASLLAALRDAVAPTPADDPGLTTHEMALKLYGKSNAHTRHMVCLKIRTLMDEGKMVRGQRKLLMIDGRNRSVPVWAMP